MKTNSVKGILAKRMFACVTAGVLLLSGMPAGSVRAVEKTVYVSGFGSGENTGSTPDSPLSSIYGAAEKLTDGGIIVVTDTVYISGEVSYYLPDGVALKAAEGMEGPLFEVTDGSVLSLNKIVIDGNNSALIMNYGTLHIGEEASFRQSGSSVLAADAVETAEGAATYQGSVLIEGSAETEVSEETGKTVEGEVQPAEFETVKAETESLETAESKPSETEKSSEEETGGEERKETDNKPSETKETDSKTTEKENPRMEDTETKEKDAKEKDTETKENASGEAEVKKHQTEAQDTTGSFEKETEPGASEKPDKEEPKTEEDAFLEKESAAEGKEEAGTAESGLKESGKETDQAEEASIVFLYAVKDVEAQIAALHVDAREDIAALVKVTKAYEALSAGEKAALSKEASAALTALQEAAASFNHTDQGIRVSGNLPWYVQFCAAKRKASDAEKANFEILAPYELKLWDMYRDKEYKLEKGQKVRVTMPLPGKTPVSDYTVFHYRQDGTVETIVPDVQKDTLSFETDSFSPFSVAGNTVITGIGVLEGETGDRPVSAGSQTGGSDTEDNSTAPGSETDGNQDKSNDSGQPRKQVTTSSPAAGLPMLTGAATGDPISGTVILKYAVGVIAAAAVLVILIITTIRKKK